MLLASPLLSVRPGRLQGHGADTGGPQHKHSHVKLLNGVQIVFGRSARLRRVGTRQGAKVTGDLYAELTDRGPSRQHAFGVGLPRNRRPWHCRARQADLLTFCCPSGAARAQACFVAVFVYADFADIGMALQRLGCLSNRYRQAAQVQLYSGKMRGHHTDQPSCKTA